MRRSSIKSSLLARSRGTSGFTLVEIMVVVTIIGMLAAVVVPNVMNQMGKSRQKDALIQIKAIESACEMFKLDVGRYPNSLDELNAPTGDTWDGPYLQGGKLPKDPWGNEFTYRADKKFVIITSMGGGEGNPISNSHENGG